MFEEITIPNLVSYDEELVRYNATLKYRNYNKDTYSLIIERIY